MLGLNFLKLLFASGISCPSPPTTSPFQRTTVSLISNCSPNNPLLCVPKIRGVMSTHAYRLTYLALNSSDFSSLLAPSLKPRLQLTFVNQAGMDEMGLDGGGLFREFLTQCLTQGFHPSRGWFLYTDDNTLYPNPNAANVSDDFLKHYYFLGRLLAKASD